jgi:hypothetical protein
VAREIALFLEALRLAWKAQAVRTRGPAEVARRLAPVLSWRGLHPDDALRATARACSRLGRWGSLDSCLVRSLVFGSLMAGAGQVRLRVGFRPAASGDGDRPDGHAWVTIGEATFTPVGEGPESGFTEVLAVPLSPR